MELSVGVFYGEYIRCNNWYYIVIISILLLAGDSIYIYSNVWLSTWVKSDTYFTGISRKTLLYNIFLQRNSSN